MIGNTHNFVYSCTRFTTLTCRIYCTALVLFSHDIQYQRCPTREGVSARALTGHIVIVLPEVARSFVLAHNGADDVCSQLLIQLQRAFSIGALWVAVMMQGRNSQIIDVQPNRPSATTMVRAGSANENKIQYINTQSLHAVPVQVPPIGIVTRSVAAVIKHIFRW